jgi:hypothetical protein
MNRVGYGAPRFRTTTHIPGRFCRYLQRNFEAKRPKPASFWTGSSRDTGADATVLPWSDCRRLMLDLSAGVPGLMGGVGQSSELTMLNLLPSRFRDPWLFDPSGSVE